jgi:hypothetical protein
MVAMTAARDDATTEAMANRLLTVEDPQIDWLAQFRGEQWYGRAAATVTITVARPTQHVRGRCGYPKTRHAMPHSRRC